MSRVNKALWGASQLLQNVEDLEGSLGHPVTHASTLFSKLLHWNEPREGNFSET